MRTDKKCQFQTTNEATNDERKPTRSKRMNKEMINKSAIKLILNTYIIKKRIYKRKKETSKVNKYIQKNYEYLTRSVPWMGQR